MNNFIKIKNALINIDLIVSIDIIYGGENIFPIYDINEVRPSTKLTIPHLARKGDIIYKKPIFRVDLIATSTTYIITPSEGTFHSFKSDEFIKLINSNKTNYEPNSMFINDDGFVVPKHKIEIITTNGVKHTIYFESKIELEQEYNKLLLLFIHE